LRGVGEVLETRRTTNNSVVLVEMNNYVH